MSEVAEMVRQARAQQRITRAELALRAGVHERDVALVEAGGSVERDLVDALLLVCGLRASWTEDGRLSVSELPRDYDREQLAELHRLPMGTRLRHAMSWNGFAGRIAAAGERARATR